MIINTKPISADGGNLIEIGYQTENLASIVEFKDGIEEAVKDFGDGGEWNILVKKPSETAYYVVADENKYFDGKSLYWRIVNSDLTDRGLGEVQVQYSIDNVKKLSKRYNTKVLRSIPGDGGEEVPSVWTPWVDQVIAYKNQAYQSAQIAERSKEAIEDMGVSATTLEAGADATVTKTIAPETGAVLLTFGIPKGDCALFIAKIGETTYNEVSQALEDGKTVFAESSSHKVYIYQGVVSNKHYFIAFGSGASPQKFYYSLDQANDWAYTSNNYLLQTSTNPSSLSTSTQYAIKKIDSNHIGFEPVQGGGGAALYKHKVYVYQSAWEDPEEGTSQNGVDMTVEILSTNGQQLTALEHLGAMAEGGMVCASYGRFTEPYDYGYEVFNYIGTEANMLWFNVFDTNSYSLYKMALNYDQLTEVTVTDTVTQL